jgi:predicted RNA-binding Zn-ribbon protein involved in translation (DUF1610 family)
MGRRGVKEYRAQEALALIAADRDGERLVCPSCGSGKVARTPRRRNAKGPFEPRRVTLACSECGRQALYTPEALATVETSAPR